MAEPTSTLKAVRQARTNLELIRSKAGEVNAKLARIERQGVKQGREHQAALAQFLEECTRAALSGEELPRLDQARQAKILAGDHLTAATASARTTLQGELAAIQAEEADALARLSGAVWTQTNEWQADTRRKVVEQLATLAPALGRLIAIDEVRRRYVGERLKLTGLADDRPWSGAAVVRKFIGAIPDQLASPSLSFEQLSETTKAIVETLVSQIEA